MTDTVREELLVHIYLVVVRLCELLCHRDRYDEACQRDDHCIDDVRVCVRHVRHLGHRDALRDRSDDGNTEIVFELRDVRHEDSDADDYHLGGYRYPQVLAVAYVDDLLDDRQKRDAQDGRDDLGGFGFRKLPHDLAEDDRDLSRRADLPDVEPEQIRQLTRDDVEPRSHEEPSNERHGHERRNDAELQEAHQRLDDADYQ